MCNCRSYNRPDWGGIDEEVILDPPPSLGTKPVCVDFCMVRPINQLWSSGIETMGCCCGHNSKATRSIVLAKAHDVNLAAKLLRNDPPTQLIVWSGVETADPPLPDTLAKGGE